MAESDACLEFDVGQLCMDIGRCCLRCVDPVGARQVFVAHHGQEVVERHETAFSDLLAGFFVHAS